MPQAVLYMSAKVSKEINTSIDFIRLPTHQWLQLKLSLALTGICIQWRPKFQTTSSCWGEGLAHLQNVCNYTELTAQPLWVTAQHSLVSHLIWVSDLDPSRFSVCNFWRNRHANSRWIILKLMFNNNVCYADNVREQERERNADPSA